MCTYVHATSASATGVSPQPWQCCLCLEARHLRCQDLNANATLEYQSWSTKNRPRFSKYYATRLGNLQAATDLRASRREMQTLFSQLIGSLSMQVILTNGSSERAVGSAGSRGGVACEHPGPVVYAPCRWLLGGCFAGGFTFILGMENEHAG